MINTEVLRLEAVTQPDLLARFGLTNSSPSTVVAVSTEGTWCPMNVADAGHRRLLENLPRVGLIDNSLTITLAAYGYVGERGDQWIGAGPLNAVGL